MPVSEILGYLGMLLLLGAYGLMTGKKLRSDGAAYQAMNAVGAALVAVSVWTKGAWPAFGLEAAWCVIALTGLVAAWRGPRAPSP